MVANLHSPPPPYCSERPLDASTTCASCGGSCRDVFSQALYCRYYDRYNASYVRIPTRMRNREVGALHVSGERS